MLLQYDESELIRPFLKAKNSYGFIYFLAGHRLAQPDTQAPKIRAENEGQTSMHISKEPPGHFLPPDPPALLLEGFWDLTKAC